MHQGGCLTQDEESKPMLMQENHHPSEALAHLTEWAFKHTSEALAHLTIRPEIYRIQTMA